MADLNLDIEFFDHRKTARLRRMLGPDADRYPIKLWCYAAKHYPATGRLKGLTEEDIDAIVGFIPSELFKSQKIGDCTRAMRDCGFLDLKKNVYEIHNWRERAGHIVAFHKRAKHAAKMRWDKLKARATSNPQALLAPCPNPPNPTHPTHETHEPYPPNDAGEASGSGAGSNGGAVGLGGNLGLDLRRTNEQIEKQSILAPLIRDTSAVQRIVGRNDISARRIRAEIKDIERDPKVTDVGGVLLKRFGESNGRKQ